MSGWQNRARCRNEDPDLMDPKVATLEQIEEAKAVCVGCEVWVQCAELAAAQAEPSGVWAGVWHGPLPAARCEWCEGPVETDAKHQGAARFCRSACRVAAHRARSKVSA